MEINYPTQVTKQLNDCEQFISVFKQLVKDKVECIDYTAIGIVKTIYFKDGSTCGGLFPWFQSGAADYDEWKKIVNEY